MDENKLYKSLVICVLVLAGLALGVFVPRFNVAGYELKNVDLFADIRYDLRPNKPNHHYRPYQPPVFDITYLPYLKNYTRYLSSSVGITPLLALPRFVIMDEELNKRLIYRLNEKRPSNLKSVAELPGSTVLFEDFSADGNAMKQIYKVMNTLKRGSGKGRIAMFGDSFIEGDIFCSDVRNSLQDIFGGNGVGFVPITSAVSQFRNTIGNTFSGFSSYTVVKKDSGYEPYGAGGYCFTAAKENSLTYTVNPKYKHLDLFHDIRLFYTSPENAVFKYRLNNSDLREINVAGSDQLQQKVLKGVNATTVSFNFPASDTLKLYGASFEDSTGIYVDNFGLRGNSGLDLSQISEKMHRQFAQLRNYQLIILQYGLNVIAPETKDFSWYINPMINVVKMMKRCYPDAAILLVSVSDRSVNVNGKYQTMESVPLMVEAQREIARQSQVAFYNLFEAMGGENSMVGFVENNPPLANKDYTHLNFQGGRIVAHIFVKSLLYEYQKYNDQIKKHTNTDGTLVVSSK